MGVVSSIKLLLNTTSPGRIGNIDLDATISDGHQYSNRVTKFPIESGANISDHVIQDPEVVTIKGFVTNAPVKLFGGIGNAVNISRNVLSTLRGGKILESRVEDAYAKLMALAGFDYPFQPAEDSSSVRGSDGRVDLEKFIDKYSKTVPNQVQLINIVTGLTVYTSMIATSVNIQRDKDTGDSLIFTGTFQKVKIVSNMYKKGIPPVKLAPGTKGQGVTKVNKGKDVPKKVGVETSIPYKAKLWAKKKFTDWAKKKATDYSGAKLAEFTAKVGI